MTATRQADTVSRVPLSITAVSQQSVDRQGLKNVQDISRTTPSLTFRTSGNDSVPNIAIRGISSQLGASTTGVYLDDTPLVKRGTSGAITGGGNPIPQLFDLERVEVLRGPQGTLFGASSEGGTLRFITPPPSLTRYSGYGRTEISSLKDGGHSYEGGVAVGGPIVEDKLGFRASIWARHNAGYIDAVSIYDGHTFGKDINSGEQRTMRLAMTWAPTEKLRITPAFYYSFDRSEDNDTYWRDIPQFKVNSGTFTNVVTLGQGTGRFNFDFPDKFFPGGTFGPYNQYGVYKRGTGLYLDDTGNVVTQTSPRQTTLKISSLTLDYDFDVFSVKAITSYVYDDTHGSARGQNGIRNGIGFTTTNATFVDAQGRPVTGGFGSAPLIFTGSPTQYAETIYFNYRRSFTQEIRFSSAPGEKRLSWVGGLYYNRGAQRQPASLPSNENDQAFFIRGIDSSWPLGMPTLQGTIFNPQDPPVSDQPYQIVSGPTVVNGVPTYQVIQTARGKNGDRARRMATLNEEEYAAFAEANYMITSKLKATAGIRVSRVKTGYTQLQGGSTFGAPLDVFTPSPSHPFPNQPGDNYFNAASGLVKETPVNPKVGLSYQATERNMFYATVAKGYRAGSVNAPGTLTQCANDVAALGRPTPLTYNSDSVMSYEGGAKLRLFGNRMQLNTSAFYIDWKDPQLTVTLTCSFTYVTNASKAVSKGFDVQSAIRLFDHLTVNVAAAYTDAHYTEDFSFPRATGGVAYIVKKGGALGVPKWQYNIGLQYDFEVLGKFPSYIRTDYQYSGIYQRGSAEGTLGYNANTVKGSDTRFLTARAGASFKGVDASIFVNNLTNSHDELNLGNGAQSALVTASTFRPREIGVQLAYRF